jgi:hypothetical protein
MMGEVNKAQRGDSIVDPMISFLREIGLVVEERELFELTILPGLTIVNGALVVDRSRLRYPGDLLHEGGHLAVKHPSDRANTNLSAGTDPAEEMMAMAWAWAAGLHLRIAPEVIFHEASYKNSDGGLAAQFQSGEWFGVPMLQAYGFTAEPRQAERLNRASYPLMAKWLRCESDVLA